MTAAEEIARVEALVSALAKDDVLTSIDTYKYDVAAAAIAAGASIVNDVSGLRDPRLASLCASTGAALVLMHTAVEPKGTLLDPATYADVAAEVAAFLRARIDVALAAGVASEQLILDPGPDFAKTPAQTVAVLRRMDLLRAFGRPILLAASRKDFLGAITGRAPAARDPGTLAALGWGVDEGASILRVHDVAGAADYLAVRSVLRGERVLGDARGSDARALSRRRPATSPARLIRDRRSLNPTRPEPTDSPRGDLSCLPSWTAPLWSRAHSPTCTCSPTSSASTASAACASPTWSTPSSAASRVRRPCPFPMSPKSRPSPRVGRRRSAQALPARPAGRSRPAPRGGRGRRRARGSRRAGRGRARDVRLA